MLPYACKYYNNLAVRFVCGAKEAKICKNMQMRRIMKFENF